MRYVLAVTLLIAASAAARSGAPAPGSISGRVHYADTLRPVVTSFVRFVTESGLELGVVSTDHEGRFRLEGVPSGIHRFQVWQGAEASPYLPEIAVLPGEHVANVGFVLHPRALVRLRLETPSGREPVIERCVMERPPEIVEGVARATGSQEFRARPGVWKLYVHARGFRTVVEELELVDFDRRFLTVELSTGISVVGKVLDEEGRPIEGAVVDRLRVAEPPAEGETWTTDAAGRFDLAGGVAAKTRFRVCALGYETLVTGIDLTHAPFIERRDFVLKRRPVAGELAGRVVDERGEPVAGATVVAQLSRVPVKGETRTDADGRFRFPDWPEGDVFLETGGRERLYAAAEGRPGGEPVTLVSPGWAEVVVRPQFPDGREVPLCRLRVNDPSGRALPPQTQAGAGLLRLEEAGEYTIRVEVPGYPDPDPVRVTAAPGEKRTVVVPVDPTVRDSTLAAWVLTRDDLPLDVPHLVRVEGPGGLAIDAPVDGIGSLVLRRMPAGRFRLRALRAKRADDPGAPSGEVELHAGRGKRVMLRADPALVVAADEGDASSPGPLRVGDALLWAAGTRLEDRATLDELIAWFEDGEVKVDFLRDGEEESLRFAANALKRYRLSECLR